jgi:hypothetical protein
VGSGIVTGLVMDGQLARLTASEVSP